VRWNDDVLDLSLYVNKEVEVKYVKKGGEVGDVCYSLQKRKTAIHCAFVRYFTQI